MVNPFLAPSFFLRKHLWHYSYQILELKIKWEKISMEEEEEEAPF